MDDNFIKDGKLIIKDRNVANAVFDGLDLRESSFSNLDMSRSEFNNVNMSSSYVHSMNFSDAKFKNMNLNGSSFQDVELMHAKIGCCGECDAKGRLCVRMSDTVFDGVDLSRATVNHCNLDGSLITDIKATNVKLYDVDFDGSACSGINMVKSRIQCTNFFGAKIKNSNFTNASFENCEIDGLTVDGIDVKKAVEFYKKHSGNNE